MNERPFSLAELVRHPGKHAGEIGRLCAIGVVVLAVGGAFVYVAGFAAPARLTPQHIVNKFETYTGVHPGFRRNHAKGVCIGCLRTLSEIALWSQMSGDERRRIMAELPNRKAP